MTNSSLAPLAEPGDDLFRLMAEQWPGAVLVFDGELRLSWSNGQASAWAGRTLAPGMSWSALELPWSLEAEQLQRVLAGGRERLAPAPRTGPDGVRRTFAAQLTPLFAGPGRPTAILCVIEETPEPSATAGADTLKGVDLQSLRTLQRMEIALESARGGMWDWDLESGKQTHTENYYRMLGVDPAQACYEYDFWSNRLHPDDLPRVDDAIQRLIDGETEVYEAEYRLRHADGTWRWVFDCGRIAERNAEGKATRVVGFLVDVTERVLTREALQRSEFRYRSVATLAPGYIFEYRLDAQTGKLEPVWVSEGMQEVFGCSLDEFQRRGGWDAFVEPESAAVSAMRRERVVQGIAQSGETLMRTIDGQKKWLHVSILPVHDPKSGRVTGIIGSAYDITERKLAEQALKESEAVLRAVTENTPDWLFLIDQNLSVKFVNRPLGDHRIEDVLGRSLLEYIPEHYRASLETLYRGVFNTGRPARYDLRIVNEGGSPLHFEQRIVPVVESGNVVRSLTVAVTDVTERKRAEIALRQSQSTLQTVADSSADWLILFDGSRRCEFLNRSFRGMPPEGWRGARIEEFVPQQDRERVRSIFEHVIATGEPANFDQVLTEPNGHTRYHEMRLRAVKADGRIFGVVVNVTEMTERYQQQTTLRTQARILETMREGVVLVDSKTRINLTNPTFNAMFGYTAEELHGESIEPLYVMSRAQRRRLARRLRENADSTAALPFEFECVRRDGSRFVASCVITPIHIGDAQHWLAVLNDITERKRLEREIIEIANREQQRIGSDLHDGLGQELTGIALMLRGVVAQLRKEGSAARLDVEDVISLVNNAIESTRALARGLSPVSAERGGIVAALRTLAARASERYGLKVELHLEVGESLPLGDAAATHLYRIAQEALTNVIRHSRATQVSIHLSSAGDELQLRIEDNGRGFAGRCARSADGLGLKIMRYRAQMVGGDLVLEAGHGGGAVVRCSCPLARAGASNSQQPAALRREHPVH